MNDDEPKVGAISVPLEELLNGPADFLEGVAEAEDVLEGAALIRRMRAMADDGKGISQAELARRLGVSGARVNAMEKGAGSQGPTYRMFKRVARACGLEFDGRKAIFDPGAEREHLAVADSASAGRADVKIDYSTLEAAISSYFESMNAYVGNENSMYPALGDRHINPNASHSVEAFLEITQKIYEDEFKNEVGEKFLAISQSYELGSQSLGKYNVSESVPPMMRKRK